MWLPDELTTLCQAIIADPTLNHDHKPQGAKQPAPLHPRRFSPDIEKASTPFPLLSLPLDILVVHLPSHLPASAVLALRLSSRSLHAAIPQQQFPSKHDACERNAALGHVQESKESPCRKRCIICGEAYPVELFDWNREETGHSGDHDDDSGVTRERRGGLLVAEMENRICRWHRGRFEKVLVRKRGEEMEEESGWSLEEACMHCGGVFAWNRCECRRPCQTCWKRRVWCLTRVVDDNRIDGPE